MKRSLSSTDAAMFTLCALAVFCLMIATSDRYTALPLRQGMAAMTAVCFFIAGIVGILGARNERKQKSTAAQYSHPPQPQSTSKMMVTIHRSDDRMW